MHLFLVAMHLVTSTFLLLVVMPLLLVVMPLAPQAVAIFNLQPEMASLLALHALGWHTSPLQKMA